MCKNTHMRSPVKSGKKRFLGLQSSCPGWPRFPGAPKMKTRSVVRTGKGVGATGGVSGGPVLHDLVPREPGKTMFAAFSCHWTAPQARIRVGVRSV